MGFAKRYQDKRRKEQQGDRDFTGNRKLEYKKYRARAPVKSFRDLDVYQMTNGLAAALYHLQPPDELAQDEKFLKELDELRQKGKEIPVLIAEATGDKFRDIDLALNKMEDIAGRISAIMTKIDFINYICGNDQEFKKKTMQYLKKYQTARVKILNLKKAWEREFSKS